MEHAFSVIAWDKNAFELVAKKTAEINDIRSGLFLLKESGLNAEEKSTRKITLENVKSALGKLEEFTIKKADTLDEESKNIFEIIKNNSGLKIGELFKIYQENEGTISYKTFQRKIAKLGEGKFVTLTKQTGAGGNTTIIDILGKKY